MATEITTVVIRLPSQGQLLRFFGTGIQQFRCDAGDATAALTDTSTLLNNSLKGLPCTRRREATAQGSP